MNPSQTLRRLSLVALLIWLVALVMLPVGELLQRSLKSEISVAIFGPEEIRLGGRVLRIEGDTVYLDDKAYSTEGATFEAEGFRARIEEGEFLEAACSRIMLYDRPVSVAPIRVEITGDRWIIDGVVLGEEDYQRTVSRYVGAATFREYLSNPGLRSSIGHSLFTSSTAMAVAVFLAFFYAYGLTRTRMPGKAIFRIVAVLPLFAPTMLYGLSLIYLFGNQGLITTGFFEHVEWLAFDIKLYGPVGIIIAETVFAFPAAFIVLRVALGSTDARLYEAATMLGASRLRIFWTVTLPGVRLGLFNAALICFTLAFTDFGAPKIVGGNYNVLAVDVYKQVVGQQNFSMGAVVSLVLLVPAVVAFVLERWIQRRGSSSMDTRSVPYQPDSRPIRDGAYFFLCSTIAGAILVLVFVAGYGSLVNLWPYDLDLSFKHYDFEGVRGSSEAFWNSVRMSAYTAGAGTIIVFVSAFMIDRLKALPLVRRASYGLSILPLALPGLVIGIAFVFLFNRPDFRIPLLDLTVPNPLTPLMGTMALLVISSILHFYAVSFLTATTALRQMDPHYEEASESLGAPLSRLFFRVTLPVCSPALLEIAGYLFVSTMATVSAVIFLYSPETLPASVAIVNMDDAGDTAPAAAMCMLIVGTNILVRLGLELVEAIVIRRGAASRARELASATGQPGRDHGVPESLVP